MKKDFVAAEAAVKKLKLAKSLKKNVYMYAATGYGKTTLIKQYLDSQKYIYWSYRDGLLDRELIPEYGGADNQTIVVLDDFHNVSEKSESDYVLELLKRDDLWIIISGRSHFNELYYKTMSFGDIITIGESDLMLSADDVLSIARTKEIDIEKAFSERIVRISEGNAGVIQRILVRILEGAQPDEELEVFVCNEFRQYLIKEVISQWDMDVVEFLLKICVVDSFTLEMAEYLTNDDKILMLIDKAIRGGNYLSKEKEVYSIRNVLRKALKEYAPAVIGTDALLRQYDMAGRYYEKNEELGKALEMYELANNKSGIKNILVKNARRNPGKGFYWEFRKHYLALPESEIETSAVMMAGMCMLYSVLLQIDKSEYWYDRLNEMANVAVGGRQREAKRWLAYLNIAIPHRGVANLTDIFSLVASGISKRGEAFPEFSITSNLPSAMDGGKDFCEWSKKDVFLAGAIGKVVQTVLGEDGRGIVDLALAESFFEKGEKLEKIISHLSAAQMEYEMIGNYEMTFVIVGIRVRMALIFGDIECALQLLDSFRRKLSEQKKTQLIVNLDSLRCRLAIYENNQEMIAKWMENAPDENEEFSVLFRYQYLTKLRIYILQEKYNDALFLIGCLNYYAKNYHRHYLYMKLRLYETIIKYREGMDYKECALEFFREAEEYHFVRLISEECGAILPVLRAMKEEFLDLCKDKEFYHSTLEETEKVAKYYPSYLGSDNVNKNDFSKQAIDILTMLENGDSIKTIAEKMFITERTVKYHCSEIYKKLEVSNKTEAIQKAKAYRII